MAKAFPHDLASTADAPDAVEVYRKALAAEPDGSVVIVTVGFLTNLKNLLESKPDGHSPLAGKDLIAKKVKRWVCMGLTIPQGREWNIHRDTPASIRAIGDWPTPITFSGYEIGKEIMTASGLRGVAEDNPIRLGYEKYNGLANRESWDQTAVLFAVRGPGDLWDVHVGGSAEVLPGRIEPVAGHARPGPCLPGEEEAAGGGCRGDRIAHAPPAEASAVVGRVAHPEWA